MPRKSTRNLSSGVIAVVLAGTLVTVANADDNNKRFDWRWPGWREGLYQPPQVEYVTPPVVHQLPNYDQRPTAAPVVNIPLFYR